MLAARFVLRDWVQARFGTKLHGINRGVEREGAFYLFTLRLIPAVPYFLINLAMGLTPIRTWTFYWVSQVGMLPATMLYVNAGTQLARLESLRGILSWQLIGAFVLLGVFPLSAKKAVELLRGAPRVRALAQAAALRPQPGRDRRRLGGLVAAYIAAAVRAKVTLVEKAPHGRRLPEHRLRAFEGADQDGKGACPDQQSRRFRHPACNRRSSTSPR